LVEVAVKTRTSRRCIDLDGDEREASPMMA